MTTPERVGLARTADQHLRSLSDGALRHVGIRRRDGLFISLFAIAFVASALARINLMPGAPLWLDECWTGAIAGQPTWRTTIDQIWLDANAPLYPLFMHAWIGLFGESNASLRLPSLLFGLAAPVLVAGWRVPGLLTRDRLALATLITVGQQSLLQSNEARGYTLLAFLAAGQTFAFIGLLRRPNMSRAVHWALWTSLVGLTHYQALMLGAVQGMIYLARGREAALRTWPAALVFLPLGLELLWHAPRLAQFARPDVAWYGPVRLETGLDVVQFVAGHWLNLAIPACGLMLVIATKVGFSKRLAAPRVSEAVLWAGCSALIATVILMVIGAVRPSFAVRYVTPFIPGISLLLVAGARTFSSVVSGAVVALMLIAAAGSGFWTVKVTGHLRHPFTFEAASGDLMALHPSRLVFIWDHPAQKVEAVRQYDALGGFLFRRAGSTVAVTSVMARSGEDPNLLLLAAAREPQAVILWLYDRGVHDTAAIRHPPRLETLDPSFGCRNYGRGGIGVLACARAWRLASDK